MTDKDREMLKRLRSLRRIEDNPMRWTAAIHAMAVRKLQQVRQIVGG